MDDGRGYCSISHTYLDVLFRGKGLFHEERGGEVAWDKAERYGGRASVGSRGSSASENGASSEGGAGAANSVTNSGNVDSRIRLEEGLRRVNSGPDLTKVVSGAGRIVESTVPRTAPT